MAGEKLATPHPRCFAVKRRQSIERIGDANFPRGKVAANACKQRGVGAERGADECEGHRLKPALREASESWARGAVIAERSFDLLCSLRIRILIGCSTRIIKGLRSDFLQVHISQGLENLRVETVIAERSFDLLCSLRIRTLIGCSPHILLGLRRRAGLFPILMAYYMR